MSAFDKSPQEIEKIKKDCCKILKHHDLKITVEANATKVNFLDVTLDLKSGKHYAFTKDGNIPLYVCNKFNLIKNIPEAINKRLSQLSSDKECFDKTKSIYQEVLNKSGYDYNLTFKKSQNDAPPGMLQTHQETAKETFYGLILHTVKNVETKVGKIFLSLIDMHFPESMQPSPQNS